MSESNIPQVSFNASVEYILNMAEMTYLRLAEPMARLRAKIKIIEFGRGSPSTNMMELIPPGELDEVYQQLIELQERLDKLVAETVFTESRVKTYSRLGNLSEEAAYLLLECSVITANGLDECATKLVALAEKMMLDLAEQRQNEGSTTRSETRINNLFKR